MDRIVWLPIFQRNGDTASFIQSINLQRPRLRAKFVERLYSFSSQVVPSQAAQNRSIIPQPSRHHGKVRRSTAESSPLWHYIPEQLANPENQRWLHSFAFDSLFLALPSPDRAVFMSRRSVFAIRLIGQNSVVGLRSGSRPLQRPLKIAYKPLLLFE